MMQHMNLGTKYILLPLSIVIVCFALWIKYSFTDEFLSHLEENSKYDFIIVGAGTAGCVLASKLSENPKNKVLLIEAGDKFTYFSSIPLLSTALQGTKYDWAFKTAPQYYSSFGLYNNTQFLPRGKGLGGSGMINYMIHGEFLPKDFDNWNISEWNYNSIFYSKYSINEFCPKNCSQEENSSLRLSDSNCELTNYFQKAIQKLEDPKIRFEHTNLTVHAGKRWTSYDQFLKPILTRQNLDVILNTKVHKVLTKNNRAVGLQVYRNHRKITIYSKKDVILSAGALHTPQILLLSGFGDEVQLKKHDIPVVAKLPGVGENLHDHLNVPLYVSIEKSKSVTVDKIFSFKEIWNYLANGKGVYSATPMAGSLKGPDSISVLLFAMGSTDEQLLRAIANFVPETFQALFPLYKNSSQEGFVLLSSCLQPKSRGSISLKNSDPLEMPIVDPNYLSRNEDISCIIKAIRYAMKIVDTSIFRDLGAKIHWPQLKNCQHLPIEPMCDDYLECIIRTVALTSHHPGGTCQIGIDEFSVVNNYLRVKNVSGLRVMDASILKTPVSTFPNDILVKLAEYGAQLILKSQN